MKRISIHLGPLALLLTVITICMSTLGVLSVSNASADDRLAQRYAETIRIRYELEEQGQRYLKEVNNGTASPEQEKVFRIPAFSVRGCEYPDDIGNCDHENQQHDDRLHVNTEVLLLFHCAAPLFPI